MAFDTLPPEMQQRIAAILAGNKAPAESPHQAAIAPAQAAPAPAPIQKRPSLMDHVIALRTEVSELRQQNVALMQTSEAVAQAVTKLFEMFQPAEGSTYSEQFAQESPTYPEDY